MINKQRLNNRILSLVLALVMVISMLPVASLTAFAADGDSCKTTDCTGTYTNGICSSGCYEPADLVDGIYQIGNAGQLYWFASQVNRGNSSINAMLTENIVINEKVLDDDGSLVDDTTSYKQRRLMPPISLSAVRMQVTIS